MMEHSQNKPRPFWIKAAVTLCLILIVTSPVNGADLSGNGQYGSPYADPAADYTINGQEYSWDDNAIIELKDDGDELVLLADAGPAQYTQIFAAAGDGSSVTIQGQEGILYKNLNISIPRASMSGTDSVTINLIDLQIKSAGIAPHSSYPDRNSYGLSYTQGGNRDTTITIDVSGQCLIEGSDYLTIDYGNGTFRYDSGADGIYSSGNVRITGSGNLTVRGGRGSDDPEHKAMGGYGISSFGTLTIEAETYVFGGDYSNGNTITTARHGISAGNLIVRQPLTAVGGSNLVQSLSGASTNTTGGDGISLTGDLQVYADVIARGGDGYSSGGAGISLNGVYDPELILQGAVITAVGGYGLESGGIGFDSHRAALNMDSDSELNAAGGGCRNGSGGYGIRRLYADLLVSEGKVSAVGGDSESSLLTVSGGIGIYFPNDNDLIVDGGSVEVVGGNGPNGGHGVYSQRGVITVAAASGQSVRIIGGDGSDGVGGVGIRAYNGGSGETVTIDGADVFVRGGEGASEQRPAVMADTVYITGGNVGPIAFESGAVNRLIQNAVNGDDVHMLTVKTSPAARVVTSSDIDGAAGSYTYQALTDQGGAACLWLPLGAQTIYAPGYVSASAEVLDTNDAELTLTAEKVRSRSGSSVTHTVSFESNGGSAVSRQQVKSGEKVTKPDDPIRDNHKFTGWFTDKELTSRYEFSGQVRSDFTLYAGWEEILQEAEMEHLAYIQGYSDGTFRPEGDLSRAETAQIIHNLAKQDGILREEAFRSFTDVDEEEWYHAAVGNLAGWDIIRGYDDGTFRPNEAVTRAEFVSAVLRYGQVPEASGNSFADVPAGYWAEGIIASAVNAGYLSGYPDGTFRPEAKITRAEAVTVINSLLECEGAEAGSRFHDVPASHWACKAITAAATGHSHK